MWNNICSCVYCAYQNKGKPEIKQNNDKAIHPLPEIMWFTGVGDPFFTILISKKVKQSRRPADCSTGRYLY